MHGRAVVDTRLKQGLRGVVRFLIQLFGGFRNLQLTVEHHQVVIKGGDVGGQFDLHGLTVILVIRESCLGRTNLAPVLAENAQLPACPNGNLDSIASSCSTLIIIGGTGTQRQSGRIAPLGRHHLVLRLLDGELGGAHIGVVGPSRLDEPLEQRILENVAPTHVAYRRGVLRIDHLAHDVLLDGNIRLVFLIEVAAWQK